MRFEEGRNRVQKEEGKMQKKKTEEGKAKGSAKLDLAAAAKAKKNCCY